MTGYKDPWCNIMIVTNGLFLKMKLKQRQTIAKMTPSVPKLINVNAIGRSVVTVLFCGTPSYGAPA